VKKLTKFETVPLVEVFKTVEEKPVQKVTTKKEPYAVAVQSQADSDDATIEPRVRLGQRS